MEGEVAKTGTRKELPDKTKKKVERSIEKQHTYTERMVRTGVASFAGLAAGVLSYLLSGEPSVTNGLQPDASIGLLLLLAAIVLQRYVFLFLKVDHRKIGDLNAKDWFYQIFMTFAFWYIAWTVLLTPVFFQGISFSA